MNLDALQQIFDSVSEDDKRKFAMSAVKWLATKGWEALTKREKKEVKSATKLIHEATMEDVKEFDPHYRRIQSSKTGAFISKRHPSSHTKDSRIERVSYRSGTVRKSASKGQSLKNKSSKTGKPER